ncbi:TauD/TfdA family dioxygenase [Burkholderiaceae bacterium FT117]|uniref:TauD/TfdA dioxygenase family protein n=1 Tax=Zeimonas sediminis TaxID=2944268 RepID=UPI0023431CE7|nr:TauD/TfdA family dioxygenase [Zeimonas sediminis]MCM5569422.1 TauD/TfdA family dioxygenase [Zeimonas sediminis]
MSLDLRPLGSFGAELHGIDLSEPMSDALFAEVERAFYDAHLLVVRGQRLEARAFHRWASRFGRPEPHVIDQFHHPEIPDILRLSNVVKDGVPQGLADAGTYFHTDYSYLAEPARATTLYSIEVPQEGGDTLFADQTAAWEDLPADTKKRLEGLVVLHHYGNRDDLDESSRTVASVLNEDQKARMQWVRHPLVVTHWYTGRKALYAVSGSSFAIEGMGEAEGRALLDELKAHSTQPRYQYRLSYGAGDVVVWDNAALLHSATLTDPKYPRSLWRITLKPA